jgi:glutamine amidotransferase-like uncharacterized protein
MKESLPIASIALIALTLTGCKNAGETAIPLTSKAVPPILLFNGNGTSPNDVTAVEMILNEHHLNYSTANSSEMNAMGESRLRAYRLLIFPGGNFVTMGASLKPSATVSIRNAVEGGLNYLGICAGAILGGDSIYHDNGLNLTNGVRFDFYAAVNRGIHKAAVPIADAEFGTLDQYWEDGPQLTGWGSVVAKYPDGTPAIVEGMSGNGWVILSGVHPEAPASWRRGMTFTTPASVDNAYAGTLIRAALDRRWLPHY